jgi:hypothetical protein
MAAKRTQSEVQSDSLPVSELIEMFAGYNPRKIAADEFAGLRRSLRRFGPVEPVVVNRRTRRIVGGHQRIKAAKAEGWESFPVIWVDLDEAGEKQLNLALNRISGEWDEEKLREVIASLQLEGADLEITGFTDSEIDQIMGAVGDSLGGEGESSASGAYRVIVTCDGALEQSQLLDRLKSEGFECRAG